MYWVHWQWFDQVSVRDDYQLELGNVTDEVIVIIIIINIIMIMIMISIIIIVIISLGCRWICVWGWCWPWRWSKVNALILIHHHPFSNIFVTKSLKSHIMYHITILYIISPSSLSWHCVVVESHESQAHCTLHMQIIQVREARGYCACSPGKIILFNVNPIQASSCVYLVQM